MEPMTGIEPAYSAWEFLTILGGGRPCIGELFARLETTLAQGNIVRALEIESVDDDFECEVPFTTVANGPIRARVLAAALTRNWGRRLPRSRAGQRFKLSQ